MKISKFEVITYSFPIEIPVQTSFGIMKDRPMILIKLTDEMGNIGYGETWCNFPSMAAQYRTKILNEVIKPLLVNQEFKRPQEVFDYLHNKTIVLMIQSGDYGPFYQSIAGVDIAVWDLFSQRESLPLWKYLGGNHPKVKVYASGINPNSPEKVVKEMYAQGYRAFKLKIGFGIDIDLDNIKNIQETIESSCALMVDANQSFDLKQAIHFASQVFDNKITWYEEPIRADSPTSDWAKLKSSVNIPIAVGENICGLKYFKKVIINNQTDYIQPDIAKWGGISKCKEVAQLAINHGLQYCPHYLGGGIGLVASAHLLAAMKCQGMLEIDCNHNPLRSIISDQLLPIEDGFTNLSDAPGLGIKNELGDLQQFMIQ